MYVESFTIDFQGICYRNYGKYKGKGQKGSLALSESASKAVTFLRATSIYHSSIVFASFIVTESEDSWSGAWSSIHYYATKKGEVIGCREGHKVILKGSRITDLEYHVLGFLKQPAGILRVLHSNKHRDGVCVQGLLPSLTRKEPGRMEEKRGGSRVVLQTHAATDEPGTCGELSCGILTDEAARDSTAPGRAGGHP